MTDCCSRVDFTNPGTVFGTRLDETRAGEPQKTPPTTHSEHDQVLHGMKQTLARRRPHLIIERSPADTAVVAFLRPVGYDFFVSSGDRPPTPYSADSPHINLVCIPSPQLQNSK